MNACEKRFAVPVWIKSFLFACIPLACCLLYIVLQGLTPLQLSPVASAWNDEFNYLKQIQGIADYGMPPGYFGYDGMTAEIGTLGSWSAFVLFPYVPFAWIFGASFSTMLYANLFYSFCTCMAFYFLARPSGWQCAVIGLIFAASPIVLRYTLSYMVEPLFLTGAILMAGMIVYLVNHNNGRLCLWALYALVFYLALCRAYFAAFVLFPFYFHWKLSAKRALLTLLGFLLLFGVLYVRLVTQMMAPFVVPTVDTTIFAYLKSDGLAAALRYMFDMIKAALDYIFSSAAAFNMADSESDAFMAASCYIALWFCMACCLVLLVVRICTKKRAVFSDRPAWLAFICLAVNSAILLAIFLFYSVRVGSRHVIALFLFTALLLCLLCFSGASFKPKYLFTCILLVLFAAVQWSAYPHAYTFMLPNSDNDQFAVAPIAEQAERLERAVVVLPDASPWANTVLFDYAAMKSSYCYYLPAGAGIQFVTGNYIATNVGATLARYGLTGPGSYLQQILEDSGWVLVIKGDEYVMYENPAYNGIR